ncbi:hypothetical protein BJ875DRAFT_157742 [Amylocarpus encephaloides]|uniref:Ubiquitin-activating enzyme E1-like n=1 Tax=Amylocarpus encephaloides TaxID=45428 RepID=A0A9P7YB04_9HELO|nr:hypothetical protein BJ875DRAFT_157742 [Amylocarpus encephaloides]
MVQFTKRDQSYHKSLGSPTNALAKEARVLMVGAGGIGCELLKNLVLSGFGEIHIVDLDTIDLSNLNRQFLFRYEHIKKSKALVAKEAAHAFNPSVKLEAHHSNIIDPGFNVAWFKSFTMVFNALDNLDARRHVNKMCLAADVPLIESGTTGFNGQVQVIKKGVTACYECSPKELPKTFPVCTIRSTPSQAIHCIVWGKSYLLSEIFGTSEEESAQIDSSEDLENEKEIEKLRQESQALKKIRGAMGTQSFPQLLFDKVYQDDVNRLLSMEDMWKTRRPPQPLKFAKVMEKAAELAPVDQILKDDQRAWTLEENVAIFTDSLARLSSRMQSMKTSSKSDSAEPTITFDKDDQDTLDFVTASANLRSLVFGIDTKSRFDIKQMAGNIIPAIATTNAIVAGLCVLQSFKVLKGDFSSSKEVFLSPFAPQRLLSSDKPRTPNPDCPVCSVAQALLLVDMSRATLGDLVEDFLRLELGYGEEFAVVNHQSQTLYDVEETHNLTKKFSDLGIKGDNFLKVIDEGDENPRVDLVLNFQESSISPDDKPVRGVNFPPASNSEPPSSPIARRRKPVEQSNGHTADAPNGNGSALVTSDSGIKKRQISEIDEVEIPAKRSKVQSNGYGNSGDTIVLDDTADVAILIDDD